MRKALQIARLSKKCAIRHKAAQIPLCAPECQIPCGVINKQIRKWLSLQQQTNGKTGKSWKKMFGFPDVMSKKMPRLISKRKRKIQQRDPLQGISGESLEFLKRFKNATPMAERAPQPGNVAKCNYQPLQVDGTNPAMAKHLRNVMESGILNRMYEINFYYDYTPENLDWNSLQMFLDPDEIARLLDILRRDGDLMYEEWDYLMNFLKALAQLSPEDLLRYMTILHAAGLLTANVLALLRNLLSQMGLQLTQSEVRMILSAFGTVEHLHEKKHYRRVIPTLSFDESLERYYGAFDRSQLVPIERKYKRRRSKPYRGYVFDDPFGYYMPWDTMDLKWQEAQSLVRKSQKKRSSRINLNTFEYQRGLEKYQADLQRSKISSTAQGTPNPATQETPAKQESPAKPAKEEKQQGLAKQRSTHNTARRSSVKKSRAHYGHYKRH